METVGTGLNLLNRCVSFKLTKTLLDSKKGRRRQVEKLRVQSGGKTDYTALQDAGLVDNGRHDD